MCIKIIGEIKMLSIQPNFATMALRKRNLEPNYAPKVKSTNMTDSVSFAGGASKKLTKEQAEIIKKLQSTILNAFPQTETISKNNLKISRNNPPPGLFSVKALKGISHNGVKYTVRFNNPTFNPLYYVSFINIRSRSNKIAQGFEFNLYKDRPGTMHIGRVYDTKNDGLSPLSSFTNELRMLFNKALEAFKIAD